MSKSREHRPQRRSDSDRGPQDPVLGQGREHCRRHAWDDAYRCLALADRSNPLAGDDLERLAMSACLTGRDDAYLDALGRAHAAHLETGRKLHAARCAFWMALRLLFRGENGRANGWLARAGRLIEGEAQDCAERGYLLLPIVEQRISARDWNAAQAAADSAAAIGDRFAERDLSACARHLQGRIRIGQGRVPEGLALLDEAMIAVATGELSPLMTGLIYCSVIDACQGVCALDRAREWTEALSHWCSGQAGMVAFTGPCMVHRAEVLQMQGAWTGAVAEAQRACDRCLETANRRAAAAACYQQGEVFRLQGRFADAERAYRNASQWGWDPQPGLALLRASQRRTNIAVLAISRAVDAAADEFERLRLLPGYVEIMLAAGEIDKAREGCAALEAIARRFDTDVPTAVAAQARGMVELAAGDAHAALGTLRRAWDVWQRIDAPYPAAKLRALIGLACRALGDIEACELEFAAARAVFEQLGAQPDLAAIDAAVRKTGATTHGLTARELQVLRLIASGRTNRAIAAQLSVSERTIDRHVSNIFTKLDLPSRSAATAYAYEHGLV